MNCVLYVLKMNLIIWLACLLGIAHGIQKSIPSYKLLNGDRMPAIGLGTFLMTPEQVDIAVSAALEYGYRHIDTAAVYQNEKDIGHVLKKWFAKGNKREDVFITTKLPMNAMRASDVEDAVESSLTKLGLNYIDMYLIHTPFGLHSDAKFNIIVDDNGEMIFDFPEYKDCADKNATIDTSTDHIAIWRALEKQVRAGKLKSIGLSNFNKTQILRIWKFAEIKPSNLQVETNAYLQQEELRELCQQLGIVMTAYSPLGSGDVLHLRRKREITILPPVIEHPVVKKIAKAHNKSPAQVVLRFGFQRRIVVIPKSTNPKRIKENIGIFDFILNKEEMDELKSLDLHGKYRKFTLQAFPGIEHHPEYPFTDKIPK